MCLGTYPYIYVICVLGVLVLWLWVVCGWVVDGFVVVFFVLVWWGVFGVWLVGVLWWVCSGGLQKLQSYFCGVFCVVKT